MPSAPVGAPRGSGPERAATDADRQAATSAPVLATTRPVNVDAFMPCSAAQTQYRSIAATCRGSGSPPVPAERAAGPRARLAAPPDHEPFRGTDAAVDNSLRHGGQAGAAGRLSDV